MWPARGTPFDLRVAISKRSGFGCTLNWSAWSAMSRTTNPTILLEGSVAAAYVSTSANVSCRRVSETAQGRDARTCGECRRKYCRPQRRY